jgi:hypothetical protein
LILTAGLEHPAMTMPSSRPQSAREAFGQSLGGLMSPRRSPEQGQRPRGRVPLKVIVALVSAILLVATATHIVPAVRAGLHDGTRGTWVATTKVCHRSACLWSGKFVAPGGHVLATGADYVGALPAGTKAGTSVPALYTGSSSSVFPASGSDLWVELLVGLLVSLFGLYWSTNKWVADYFRERRKTVRIPGL